MSCITCGGAVEPMSDEMRKARLTFGMPLTPPKRCTKCVWSSLLNFMAAPDEEEAQPQPSPASRKEKKP